MSDDTRTCPHCGEGFTGGRPEKVYCSRRCKATASARRRAAREGNDSPGPDTPNGRTCHGCGEQLKGRSTKWCSGKCRDRWRLAHEPGYRDKVNARSRRNGKKSYEAKHGKAPDCQHCGRPKYNREGKYCSRPDCNPPCREPGCDNPGNRARDMCSTHYNQEWNAANPEKRKAMHHRDRLKRRGLKREQYVENVTRDRLMERDNWTCHLCGEKIPKSAQYPHPRYGSIDHIIPISLGGEHSYANTAASHLRCNIVKGNRAAGDQLALL